MKSFEQPLSQTEELLMLERLQAGDNQAKEILIQRNMRLVAHMVKKYLSSSRDDAGDLLSVGTIGLIKAVNSFKNDKNIRFATYAAKCIDNELLMMLRTQKRRQKEMSIYEPVGKDREGNEISLMDICGDEDPDVACECLKKEQIRCIDRNFDSALTPLEKDIIIRRFGLFGENSVTQNVLAKRLGISRSYVSRLEKKALSKLRILLEKNGLG